MEQLVDHPSNPSSGEVSPDDGVSTPGQPIAVTLWDAGQASAIEAFEGEALMLALKRAGLSILAVCGGKGACGTCKVAFPPDWAGRLPAPEKREQRLLDHIKASDGERLSCRITLTAALDGLEVDACD